MKSLKKEAKGITLISLVITIIILLILASVATYSGISVIKHSKLVAFTTELKIMQTQVNELYEKWRNEEEVNGKNVLELGQEISSSDAQAQKALSGAELADSTGYRYYNQATIKELNIEGVDGEFLINIEKRSVVSYSGITYEGETYYTLKQVPDGLYNVDYEANSGVPTFDATIKRVAGENWKITISNIQYNGNIEKWEVKYKKKDEEYWSTQYNLEFIVNNSGPYDILIQNGSVASAEKTVEGIDVKVGDYVNYTPSTVTDDQLAVLNKDINDYSGYSTTQTLSQNSLRWRVLEIDNEGNPTKLISALPTSKTLRLCGANGYNNAVYLLNKACSTLYSGEYGDAQSITIEDLEKHYSNAGKDARDGFTGAVQYGKLKRYTGSNANYPKLATQENKMGIDTETYTDDEGNTFNTIKTDGINSSDKQTEPYNEGSARANTNGITITQTYYDLSSVSGGLANAYVKDDGRNVYYELFHSGMGHYWLASRCVVTYSNYDSCEFDARGAGSGNVSAYRLFYSSGSTGSASYCLRPVVSLKSGVKVNLASKGSYNTWNLSK